LCRIGIKGSPVFNKNMPKFEVLEESKGKIEGREIEEIKPEEEETTIVLWQ